VGDPWAINGDMLLVVTDGDLQILNGKFGDQLEKRARKGYRRELKTIKNQDKKAPVVISGGKTPYFATIHVPARDIKLGEELFSYQKMMTRVLEAGIRKAVTHHSRRTVICNDAISPEELDWRDAEKTILAVEKHMYESTMEEDFCEIVQVTLPEQDRERKAEMMDGLRKVTVPPRPRGREETGHTTREPRLMTQKFQALNLEQNEEPEEEGDSCVQRAYYSGSEGTTGGPLTLTEQHSTPKATASTKGAPKSTPGRPPIPAPRDIQPAMREEVQPEREEYPEASNSPGLEANPRRPDYNEEDDNTSFISEAEKRMNI